MTTGSPQPTSDRSAASLRGGGDHVGLQSIWLENRRWIAAVILAHKPNSEDLEDLLQEVALTLVAKFHTVRDPGHVKAWLRTVAINAARAAGRSERLRPAPRDQFDSFATECARRSDVREHSRHIMNLALGLPEEYREPLLLKAQGLRSRQVAEILGINEATVDTRVSRARRMLRALDEAGSAGPIPFASNATLSGPVAASSASRGAS